LNVLLRTLLVLRKLSAELAYHLWTATLVYYGLDGRWGPFQVGGSRRISGAEPSIKSQSATPTLSRVRASLPVKSRMLNFGEVLRFQHSDRNTGKLR
jgi:hypothetical protein